MENHKTFELKKEHLALIKCIDFTSETFSLIGNIHSAVSPFGGVDLKTDLGDILIGRELSEDEKTTLRNAGTEFKTREDSEWMLKIYQEVPQALDVINNTFSFEPGIYRTRWYDRNWKKIG